MSRVNRASVLRLILGLALLSAPFAASSEQSPANHSLMFDDLMAMGRVADPQVSPDGKWVAYVVTRYDKEKNGGNSDIWIVPSTGGEPRQLTRDEKRDNQPRWSHDGKKIAFISDREGGPQIWIVDVASGETRKHTSISTGADGLIWSSDGRYLAFSSEVYPECKDDPCNQARNTRAESSKVKARIIDRLLFRHWDSWKDGKRTHIFVVPAQGGTPQDVTPGDYDAPPFSLGGPLDYDFAPDGKELCFARNTDRMEATSTNADLWIVTSGGAPRKITSNPAYDGSPLYSPDGKYIAYRAQQRPGFESDRFELVLYDRQGGNSRTIHSELDRSVSSMAWAPDSKSLFFTAEDEGNLSIFRTDLGGEKTFRLVEQASNDDVEVSPDGRALVFTRQTISQPAELYRCAGDGGNITPITRTNQDTLAKIKFGAVESIRYPGTDDASIQAWLVKPPQFNPDQKWPAVVLIHGGPQGAWNDAFSYRWNLQMFASRGYVVFAPNPRGSLSLIHI